MTLVYVTILDLTIQKTNIGPQEINGFILITYKMVIVGVLIRNKLKKI